MKLRRARKHWRSTVAGALLGAIETVRAIADYTALTTRELVTRLAVAAAFIAAGALLKDYQEDVEDEPPTKE